MRMPKTAFKTGLNEVTVSPDFGENINFEVVYLLTISVSEPLICLSFYKNVF